MNGTRVVATFLVGAFVMAGSASLAAGRHVSPTKGVRASSSSRVLSAPRASTPFARVYLALRGCTSCSHCRTTIRQMARSGSGGAEARVSTDAVEVRYAKPGPIRLREVIRRLSENRLHDLTLVDVLFEAEGTIATNPAGTTFTLTGTDQSFPLAIEPTLTKPTSASPVRLTAVVEGWRGKGTLRLVARDIHRDS